jgi:hypothetical protein
MQKIVPLVPRRREWNENIFANQESHPFSHHVFCRLPVSEVSRRANTTQESNRKTTSPTMNDHAIPFPDTMALMRCLRGFNQSKTNLFGLPRS